MDFEKEINQINSRNARVEMDKAWEISWTRFICIAVITYITIVVFLHLNHLPRPWISAIVPVFGYTISTFSIPLVKKLWINWK